MAPIYPRRHGVGRSLGTGGISTAQIAAILIGFFIILVIISGAIMVRRMSQSVVQRRRLNQATEKRRMQQLLKSNGPLGWNAQRFPNAQVTPPERVHAKTSGGGNLPPPYQAREEGSSLLLENNVWSSPTPGRSPINVAA